MDQSLEIHGKYTVIQSVGMQDVTKERGFMSE